MHCIVIQNLVVNLVCKNYEVVLYGKVRNGAQHFLAIHGTRWVIGVNHHNGTGTACNFRSHVIQVRIPLIIFITQVMHRVSTSEAGAGSPQRIIRSRNKNFITFVE